MSNLRKLQKPKLRFEHVRDLSSDEIVQVANYRNPDGRSGQYEIQSNRPNFKFIYPKKSAEYMRLKAAYDSGKVRMIKDDETDPVLIRYKQVQDTKVDHNIVVLEL